MKRGMTLWRYFTDSQEHAGGFIMVKAVVGANWGDEGKGKITDMLAEKADIIIRFQGGANAGHTIINDYGKFALHTLPSGVFYGHTTSIIGNGVAVDIPVLFKEIQSIIDRDVPMPKILVSDRAQMVMSYHKNFDAYEEERLGGKSFGSTKSGIAPFYSDKYAKIGFQISELFEDEAELREKVNRVAEQKNVMLEHLYHKPLINPDDLYNELMEYKEMVAPYVCNVSLYLDEALKEGKEILLEGQLGTLKDPDHGIYPMVTSSSTLAAYGAPDARDNTVVVVSSDRMGSGNDELGKVLIKGFIFAVTQLDTLPKTMLFYNGGATLTTEGSDSLEDLKSLEAQGVEIMTCGTCLDYYGLKDKLAVGTVTNMYSIVETMAKAGRIVRPS